MVTKKTTATGLEAVAWRVYPANVDNSPAGGGAPDFSAAGGDNLHATERDAIDAVAELDDSCPVAGGGWAWAAVTDA